MWGRILGEETDKNANAAPVRGSRQYILVAFAGIVALIIILPIFTMLGLWVWENALRIQSGGAADYTALPWHFWIFLLASLVVAAVAAGLISERFGQSIFGRGASLLGGQEPPADRAAG